MARSPRNRTPLPQPPDKDGKGSGAPPSQPITDPADQQERRGRRHGSWVSTNVDLTALIREAEAKGIDQEALDNLILDLLRRHR